MFNFGKNRVPNYIKKQRDQLRAKGHDGDRLIEAARRCPYKVERDHHSIIQAQVEETHEAKETPLPLFLQDVPFGRDW